MCGMCNHVPRANHEEIIQCKQDDHHPELHWYGQREDIHMQPRHKHRKSAKNTVYRTTCAQRGMSAEDAIASAREDAGEKKDKQELHTTYTAFQQWCEEEEDEHIDNEMPEATMQEDMRYKRPWAFKYVAGNQNEHRGIVGIELQNERNRHQEQNQICVVMMEDANIDSPSSIAALIVQSDAAHAHAPVLLRREVLFA